MDEKARTLLLVDDDVDLLEVMKLKLQGVGFRVLTAGGQQEAEKILAETTPDLAVVDLMMECADGGFALCYEMKKTMPSVPVIILSAVTSETGIEFDASTDEERSWVKADAFLAKPVRFEQLQREIGRLLGD